METIQFKDFQTKTTPATVDYIVGYDVATGEEIKIQLSSLSQTGQDGASVQIQYTDDLASNLWHFPFQTGDVYMRQRIGTGSWSSAIKMSLDDSDKEILENSVKDKLLEDADFQEQISEEINNKVADATASLQSQINQKANQSDLNQTNTTVGTHTTQISSINDSITSINSNISGINNVISNISDNQKEIDSARKLDDVKYCALCNVVAEDPFSISYYDISGTLQSKSFSQNEGAILEVVGVAKEYNNSNQINLKQTLSFKKIVSPNTYYIEIVRFWFNKNESFSSWIEKTKVDVTAAGL